MGLPKPGEVHLAPQPPPDAGLRAPGFNVCHAGLQFGFLFPVLFWNGNFYPVPFWLIAKSLP